MRRPSLSLVVALLALVMASAGAGYAAGQLPAGSVGTPQLQAHAVTLAKVAPSAVKALKGHQGPRGKAGPRGPAGQSALATLKPGEVLRGAWSVTGVNDASTGITFPVPTAQLVADDHVVVAGNDTESGDGCTGTAAAPIAAKGFVCIYFAYSRGTTGAEGVGANYQGGGVGSGSRYGFGIDIYGGSLLNANGTWAYTAP